MTVIEGDSGLIIIDPLVVPDSARAALELYYQHRPKKPVVAVIYSHSHLDHFGGVTGVVSEADVKAGKVKIFAPEGFMEEASSENLLAGNAMSRRALFMYGMMVKPGPQGHVDDGIGKSIAIGRNSLIPPTYIVNESGKRVTIDGVEVEFVLAPGTEAPSEMMLWFPQMKVLNGSELFNATDSLAKPKNHINIPSANAKAMYIYYITVTVNPATPTPHLREVRLAYIRRRWAVKATRGWRSYGDVQRISHACVVAESPHFRANR